MSDQLIPGDVNQVTPDMLPVPHICRTCGYWDSNSPKDEWAVCAREFDIDAPMGISSGSCDERPTLDTQFDFGCNQWQPDEL